SSSAVSSKRCARTDDVPTSRARTRRPETGRTITRSGRVARRRGRRRAPERVLQLAKRERLLQILERLELGSLDAERRDARADDWKLRKPFAENLGRKERAKALRLDHDRVDPAEAARHLGHGLVADPASDEGDELTDLRIGLEDEDATHGCHDCRGWLTIGWGSV